MNAQTVLLTLERTGEYVFKKDDQAFKQHQAREWCTHTYVKSWKKIQVSFYDLPKNIQLT